MFTHYLYTALRHFRRQKLVTAINVACLAIGLAGFLATHWLATSMRASDTFYPNVNRIYVLTQRVSLPGMETAPPTMPMTGWAVAPQVKTAVPELEAVARALVSEQLPVKAGENKTFLWVRYADADFFKIFKFDFVAGNSANPLGAPRSAVLTEPTAVRLFGSARAAVGQPVLIDNGQPVTVAGVIPALRGPSHMQPGTGGGGRSFTFDVIASSDVYVGTASIDPIARFTLDSWLAPIATTYILLPADGSLTTAELNRRLAHLAQLNALPGSKVNQLGSTEITMATAKLLDSVIGADKSGVSSTVAIYLLGALILLVSCLNYVNLATAQGQRQAKEVGMRRVIGARSGQVASQYLFEAALLTSVALVIALVADIVWGLVIGNSRAGAWFQVDVILAQPSFWLVLLALPCVVAIVAGAYPAFVCARMRPIVAVRSGQDRRGASGFATFLVGAQFAAASFLLISILIMTQQNREVQRAARAAFSDPTIVITNDALKAGVDYESLRAELLRQPHVRSVSGSMFAPWSNSGFEPVSRTADVAAKRITVTTSYVNYDYFDALGFELLAGRVFDRTRADRGLVIDRALATQLGWSNPADAVGKTMTVWRTPPNGPAVPEATPVIGVVANKPLVLAGLGSTTNAYELAPTVATHAIVRVSRDHLADALGEIDAVWARMAPNVAIQRKLIDDLMVSAFGPFEMIANGFSAVASLALVGAVLGLIGMSLHAIGRRAHEIGVRKTLGASVLGILRLLLKDFSKPVVIANVIAWPLAFVAMQIYLSIFMQRVGLSWTPFILSLAIALAVAWLSVIVQASRAARVNPATVLRYE